MSLLFYPQ